MAVSEYFALDPGGLRVFRPSLGVMVMMASRNEKARMTRAFGVRRGSVAYLLSFLLLLISGMQLSELLPSRPVPV